MAQPTTGKGAGASLQYNPEKYGDEKNKGNYRKLSEALEVSVCTCVHGWVEESYHMIPPLLPPLLQYDVPRKSPVKPAASPSTIPRPCRVRYRL